MLSKGIGIQRSLITDDIFTKPATLCNYPHLQASGEIQEARWKMSSLEDLQRYVFIPYPSSEGARIDKITSPQHIDLEYTMPVTDTCMYSHANSGKIQSI